MQTTAPHLQLEASVQALREASEALMHNIRRKPTGEDVRLLLKVNLVVAELVTKQHDVDRERKRAASVAVGGTAATAAEAAAAPVAAAWPLRGKGRGI